MSTPRPWRERPESPEDAQAAALLERLSSPDAPIGAQARVWRRLGEPAPAPARPWLVPALGVGAVAVAAAIWLLPAGSVPPQAPLQLADEHRPALAPAPIPEVELAVLRGPARLDVDGFGTVELPVDAAVEPPAPGSARVVVLMGPVRAVAHAAGLELVSGRYHLALEPGAEVEVSTGPFEARAVRGRAQLNGPEGTSTLEPEVVRPPVARAPRHRAPAPDVAPGPGGPRLVDAPVEPAELYRRARVEPNPDVAVALFDRVAVTDGPFAEMAGHQAVRRRIEQGRLQDAVRRLDALEARFPEGAHLPELWLTRVECRVAMGTPSAARRDIDAYLARWPSTPRSQDLYFLRAELHRGAGRYGAAVADYGRVAGGEHAEEAAYLGAWCRAEAGDAAAARSAAAAYLSRWPEGRFAEAARRLKKE